MLGFPFLFFFSQKESLIPAPARNPLTLLSSSSPPSLPFPSHSGANIPHVLRALQGWFKVKSQLRTILGRAGAWQCLLPPSQPRQPGWALNKTDFKPSSPGGFVILMPNCGTAAPEICPGGSPGRGWDGDRRAAAPSPLIPSLLCRKICPRGVWEQWSSE